MERGGGVEGEALSALTLDAVPAVADEGAPVAIGLGERMEDERKALVGEVEGVVAVRAWNGRRLGWRIDDAKLDFHGS